MACSFWHTDAGLILYAMQYTESDALSLDMKIFWLDLDMGGNSRVRSVSEKNYQEEWKIIMIINIADEFRI